jgi:DNA-binding GntR family transcriptional regulator
MSKLERPQSLKEQILNILRKEIIKGNMKPGEHISESEIARKFGTSRGPVREALAILENEGFLTRSENGSIFVTTLTKKDAYEIYTMRSVIEGLAARLAVEKFTTEDIAYLDKCLNEIAELESNVDGVNAVPNTLEIHRFVMEKANHRRLFDLWMNLNLQLKILASVVMTYDRIEDTLIKHSQLVEALKKRDPLVAEQAMRDHIMEAWQIVDNNMNAVEKGT